MRFNTMLASALFSTAHWLPVSSIALPSDDSLELVEGKFKPHSHATLNLDNFESYANGTDLEKRRVVDWCQVGNMM